MRISQVLLAYGLLLAMAVSAAAATPNIVLMVADDQGYADLSCYGSDRVDTPNIDSLAAQGMRFTSYYSASSVCTPSRSAMMTGRYPKRCGMPNVLFPRSTTGLAPEEVTIAEMLKARGYATACIGKWHMGHQPQFMPTNQGFDSYYGIPYSNDMSIAKEFDVADDVLLVDGCTMAELKSDQARYLDEYAKLRNRVPLLRGSTIIEYPVDQSTLTGKYTRAAVQFIEENKDGPFFLYLPQTMPHRPIFASADFEGTSDAGAYGDSLHEIDWCVGEILKSLKSNGLADNTLFIYTSDNGPAGGAGGSAEPLRGTKFTTFEGGHRVPMVMWGPGIVAPGKTSDAMICAMDMLPTLASLVDGQVPTDRTIDGRNILPLIQAAPRAKSPHEAFLYYRANSTDVEGIRMGDWKYLRTALGRGKNKKPTPQLYNLANDIGETTNLIGRYPEKAASLVEEMGKLDGEM